MGASSAGEYEQNRHVLRISHFVSEMMQLKRQGHSYYGTRIGKLSQLSNGITFNDLG